MSRPYGTGWLYARIGEIGLQRRSLAYITPLILLCYVSLGSDLGECLAFFPVVQTGSPPHSLNHKGVLLLPPLGPRKEAHSLAGKGWGTQFRRRYRHSGTLCILYSRYGLGSRKNKRNETVAAVILSIPLKVKTLPFVPLVPPPPPPPTGANPFQIYIFYLTGEGGGGGERGGGKKGTKMRRTRSWTKNSCPYKHPLVIQGGEADGGGGGD